MKKGLIFLLAGGAVAGLGYGLYSMKKKNSGGSDPGADLPGLTDEPTPDNAGPEGKYNPPATGKTYLEKIKELQTLLGVVADGVPGPKTMGALNKYVVRNVLNASNIDDTLKKVSFLKDAIASLSTNRTRTNKDDKRKMWDYWVKRAPNYGIAFDKGVTNVYQNITGRSAYVDYKDVLTSNQPAYNPYDAGPIYGLGTLSKLA